MTTPQLEYDDPTALLEDYFERGWTDGLPVVPPTPEVVDRFLRTAGIGPDEVIGTVPTREVTVTAELAAVNAVMAGCRPEYFPAVLAALRAHLSLYGNAHCTTGTLAGASHCVILNGPVRTELGVACGQAALGPGFRPNATIGRALRLVIRNVCRSIPGFLDRATFASPLRYSFCFGEDEEAAAPWLPLHVQRGFAASDSTVTVASVTSVLPVMSGGRTPEAILDDIVAHLRFRGAMSFDRFLGDTVGIPMVVGPEHLRYFHEAGWSKADAQEYLWPRLAAPATGPHDKSVALPRPDSILLVVAGGPGVTETQIVLPHLSAPVTEPIR